MILPFFEGYLEGNTKIKISIKHVVFIFDKTCGFHIRQYLTTTANWKCGPENCLNGYNDT